MLSWSRDRYKNVDALNSCWNGKFWIMDRQERSSGKKCEER